jgi:Ubiquitin carboxyl-terminal hydrolase, family 1
VVADCLSPVYGVIFLFKYPTGEKPTGTPKDGSFDPDAAENLFFAAQTIQNACGTQALLSVLLNKEEEIDLGPQLKEFREFTQALPSDVWLIPLHYGAHSSRLIDFAFLVSRRGTLKFGTHQRRPQFFRAILAFCR